MTSKTDRAIASVFAAAVAVCAAAASRGQGITRDEAYYMKAGEQYVAYYEDVLSGRLRNPFAETTIDRYWDYNPEHPPLFKLLYGVSWRLMHRCTCAIDRQWHPAAARIAGGRHTTLNLLSEVTAFRLPTAVSFGLLCALVYLFFVEAFGSRRGAAAAALLMAAQPRAFFHAQTASFDLPLATLWFATTYAYWRALDSRSWRAAMMTGCVFGLAVATKLQSALLLVALPAHWAWLAWTRRRAGEAAPDARPLFAMPAIAVPMLFGVWPWLWHQPFAHVRDYIAFHLRHEQYNFEYFGRNYNQPPYPWHEPLGMLVLTAPVVLLVLAAVGIFLLARRRPSHGDTRATPALILIAGALPVSVFMFGSLPIYGETKHWLATMAFLALAAGYAIERLCAALETELGLTVDDWRRSFVSAAVVVVAFVPAAVETIRSHPYGLSHYNALAGGAPGGADLGMNRQFWGYAVKDVLPWLDDHLPARAAVFFQDSNYDSYLMYLRDGALRPDIVYASDVGDGAPRSTADAAMVVHEKHFNDVDFRIWQSYGHVQPAQVLTLDGVPLVSLYLRIGTEPGGSLSRSRR